VAGLIITPTGLAANKGLSVPVWNPSRISGCVGWWDMTDNLSMWQASAQVGPVNADGQSVGYIADQSGRGNHFLQATSGLRPSFRTSGGRCWVEGDGATSGMATASALFASSATQTRCIALACRQTGVSDGSPAVASDSAGSFVAVYPEYSDGFYYSQNTLVSTNSADGLGIDVDVVVVDNNSPAGGNVARANGVQILNGATLAATTDVGPASIINDSYLVSWPGRLYALAVFDVAVSGEDLVQLERWLALRAQITL